MDRGKAKVGRCFEPGGKVGAAALTKLEAAGEPRIRAAIVRQNVCVPAWGVRGGGEAPGAEAAGEQCRGLGRERLRVSPGLESLVAPGQSPLLFLEPGGKRASRQRPRRVPASSARGKT